MKTVSTDAAMAGELVAQQNAIQAELKTLMLPGESYDLDFIANRLHAAENQAQFALLEIGRLFRIMQISEGNNFAKACERVGRTGSYGYRMAGLFNKLGSGERSKLLQLGTSKALEFLAFEADELDAIASNQIAGLTLDDVDRMPVAKLRAELRKKRQQLKDQEQTQDELITKRDERIKQLQKAQKLGQKYDQLVDELTADIARCSSAIASNVDELVERVAQFAELSDVSQTNIELVRDMTKRAEIAGSQLSGLGG